MHLFSPAKINLFLQILGARADGYHELVTCMQTISLGDYISISLATHESLTCTNPQLPVDENNLILKATRLFRAKTGSVQQFKIHLTKNIPMQAGLGGGSSNAATILWGCNQLLHTNIPLCTLQTWSAELGSDVPFFLSLGTAYCTGRGELIENLNPLPKRRLWIVKPTFGLSTPQVYRQLKATSRESMKAIPVSTILSGEMPLFNDLERPSFEICPELEVLKRQLQTQSYQVLMCGSGSALFCFGAEAVPTAPNTKIFSCSFTNRSAKEWFNANANF